MRRSEMLRQVIELENAYAWVNSRNDNPIHVGVGGDGFNQRECASFGATKHDLLPLVLKKLRELNELIEASKPELPPEVTP